MAQSTAFVPTGGGGGDDGLIQPQRRGGPFGFALIGAPVKRSIEEADADAQIVRHRDIRLFSFASAFCSAPSPGVCAASIFLPLPFPPPLPSCFASFRSASASFASKTTSHRTTPSLSFSNFIGFSFFCSEAGPTPHSFAASLSGSGAGPTLNARAASLANSRA